jgi:hypothetical protein
MGTFEGRWWTSVKVISTDFLSAVAQVMNHRKILTAILSFPMVLLGLEDFAKVSQSILLVVELDIL